MIDKHAAIQIAQKYAEENFNAFRSPENLYLEVFEEMIMEKSYGYIIPYQSVDYIKTRQKKYKIYGSSSIIISKVDGSILGIFSMNHNFEHKIAEFEKNLKNI
jgi:hypothetical protein